MAKSPTERHQTIENFRNDIMRSLKEFSKNEKSGSRTGFLIAVSLLSVLAAAFGGTLMPAAKLPKHDDTTSNKKVVSAPRHVRVGHSPEEKLRLICHEDDDMELARDPDRAQKTIKALNALLPELTNNKILDYIACDLKSQLYRNINVVDKAEEENKRMLEICQNKKDYRSLEVNPFSVLSQIAFMQGRIADADKFASLSIKSYIAFQNDDSNSAVIIPSFYKPYPGVRSFSCSYCILSNIAYSQHKYMEALDLAKQASILQPPWSGNQAGRPILFQVKNFLAMKQDAKAIELLNQAFQGGFELEDALEDGKSASSLLDAGFDPCDFLVTVREAAEVFSYYGSVKEARILFSYVLAHKRQVPSEQVSRCLEGLSNLNKGTKPFIR